MHTDAHLVATVRDAVHQLLLPAPTDEREALGRGCSFTTFRFTSIKPSDLTASSKHQPALTDCNISWQPDVSRTIG